MAEPQPLSPGAVSPEGMRPPGPPQINPDILSSLGLSQEDVAQHDRIEVARRENIGKNKSAGNEEYHKLDERLKREERVEFQNFNVSVIQPDGKESNLSTQVRMPVLANVPDEIIGHFEQLMKEQPSHEPYRELYRGSHNAYLEGFGEAALDQNDWATVVNAFDVATDGKILERADVMGRLKDMAAQDKTMGIEIAKAIQGRIDKRASAEPSVAVPAPSSLQSLANS